MYQGLDNQSHNFYFTLEMHASFVYIPGLSFTFRGDDDVWVFMNNQLVIDLGGVHAPLEKTFSVDELNLTEGSWFEVLEDVYLFSFLNEIILASCAYKEVSRTFEIDECHSVCS